MGAMGIVRSRDMISQTGIACTGEAGQFDSNLPAQLINWWRAGVACSGNRLSSATAGAATKLAMIASVSLNRMTAPPLMAGRITC